MSDLFTGNCGTILIQAAHDAASRAVETYARNLELEAKAACPVDTGALRTSIHADRTSDYGLVLRFLDYGLLVERGHRVGSSTRKKVTVDALGRVSTRTIFIKEKRGGRLRTKRVPPNPFLSRGATVAAASTGGVFGPTLATKTIEAIESARVSARRLGSFARQGITP